MDMALSTAHRAAGTPSSDPAPGDPAHRHGAAAVLAIQEPWGTKRLLTYVRPWIEAAQRRGNDPTDEEGALWRKALEFAHQEEARIKRNTVLVYLAAMALLGGVIGYTLKTPGLTHLQRHAWPVERKGQAIELSPLRKDRKYLI